MLIDWITIQLLGEGEVEQWVQSQTVWKNKHPESRRVHRLLLQFLLLFINLAAAEMRSGEFLCQGVYIL